MEQFAVNKCFFNVSRVVVVGWRGIMKSVSVFAIVDLHFGKLLFPLIKRPLL